MHYLHTIHILFTYLKILKIDLTVLFTYLKIILLQCFQFSNNKFNPNGPIVSIIMKKSIVFLHLSSRVMQKYYVTVCIPRFAASTFSEIGRAHV